MAQRNIVTGLHLGHKMFYYTELPMLHGGQDCIYRDNGLREIISCFVLNGLRQTMLLSDLRYFFFFPKNYLLFYQYRYTDIFCYFYENDLMSYSPDVEIVAKREYRLIDINFFNFWILKNNEWYIIYCQLYFDDVFSDEVDAILELQSDLFIKYYMQLKLGCIGAIQRYYCINF